MIAHRSGELSMGRNNIMQVHRHKVIEFSDAGTYKRLISLLWIPLVVTECLSWLSKGNDPLQNPGSTMITYCFPR
jgi:hypothetical protein